MALDDPIVIVDYDPRWPALYQARAADLIDALGDHIDRIEHIGSTSVDGLAAKPIIDIIIGHGEPGFGSDTIAAITVLGYCYHGELGVPGRGFFDLEAERGNGVAVHLHVFPAGHPSISRDLAFRDALRGDAELRREYTTRKLALSLMYRDDLDGYNRGKEGFIPNVVGARLAPAAWGTTLSLLGLAVSFSNEIRVLRRELGAVELGI